MATVTSIRKVKGGDFLVHETECDQIFIAEEWNEEQRMIAQSCKDFLDTEVFTKLDKLDSMQYPELMPGLLMKTGQLGLLGSALPEEYGGFGMDFNTNMLIAEAFGSGHSFVVAFSAHTATSVCQSAYAIRNNPENTYINVHERRAWDLLEKWLSISPDRQTGTDGTYIRINQLHGIINSQSGVY